MTKDFYTRKAKQEGYLARSAYKLKQINKRYSLLKKGDCALDLGCFPGGWIQASLESIGGQGYVIGIDLKDTAIKSKNFKFCKMDAFDNKIFEISNNFDVVLSDLAPRTTGVKELDRFRSFELAFRALEIAKKKLNMHGNLLVKIFQGKQFIDFLNECKKHFSFVKCDKPPASKRKSVEMYVICKDFIKA